MADTDPDTQTETYKIKSGDNEVFHISHEATKLSGMLTTYVEDNFAQPFPVECVESKTLALVVQYLEQHAKTDVSKEEMAEFDRELVEGIENVKFALLLAANFMHCDPLIRLVADSVAENMRGKTVDELRIAYKVKDDFTEEEKEKIRNEEKWVAKR